MFAIDGIAVDGDWLAMGSCAYPDGSGVGGAYTFERFGSGWIERDTIVAPDGMAADLFGRSVALDQDTLVVGAHRDTNPQGAAAGAAYVFVRAGTTWVHQQKLIGGDTKANDFFGHAVAVSGDAVVIGALTAQSVYVFERSGSVWSEVLTLNFGTSTGLGRSVAIDGNRFIAGAWLSNTPGVGQTGSIYVYERGPSGWSEQAVLVHDRAVDGDKTGYDVDLDGDCVVATDYLAGAGRAFVFRKTASSWIQEDELLATGGLVNDQFGRTVALGNGYVVVSDDPPVQRGPESFYLFRRTGGSWASEPKVSTTGGFVTLDLDGNRLAVGGLVDVPGGNGAIYAIPEGPTVYCSAKLNSSGCVPQISTGGSATTGGPDDFVIGASDMLPSKPGLFFFGLTDRAALPFLGGTLCTEPPLIRTPVQLSTAGIACDGTYSYPFTQADMASLGLLPADHVYGQYWARDPAHPDGTGVSLSDALEVVLLP